MSNEITECSNCGNTDFRRLIINLSLQSNSKKTCKEEQQICNKCQIVNDFKDK